MRRRRQIEGPIQTTVNQHPIKLEAPQGSVTSDSLVECNQQIPTGCGSQGSCGTCMIVVNGKPRLACTLRTKSLHQKSVQTVHGIPNTERSRILDALVKHGATQCGYCLPSIVLETYTLLQNILSPTKDDIAKALSIHSCRCLSADIFVNAIFSLTTDTSDGLTDGVHLNPERLFNQSTSQIATAQSDLQIAVPILGSKLNEIPVVADGVILFLRKDHPTTPIFEQTPTLQGFIVAPANRPWLITETHNVLHLEPSTHSLHWTKQSYTQTFLPIDPAPLEPEVCLVFDNQIHVNGLQSASLSAEHHGYTTHNHPVGGSFGGRTWTKHVDWGKWLYQTTNKPISLRMSMRQMLLLREKSPFVGIHTTDNSLSLCIEPLAHLTDWSNEVLNLASRLLNTAPSSFHGLPHSFSLQPTSISHLPQQPSESRTQQVFAWLLHHYTQLQKGSVWQNKASWANRLGEQWNLPQSWFNTVQQHQQMEQSHRGWGFSAIPTHQHHLPQAMTCTVHIENNTAKIHLGIPEADGFLSTTLAQLVQQHTNIPLSNIQYICTGPHPGPHVDASLLRIHAIQALEQCLKQYTTTESIQTLCSSHQTVTIQGNACSVVVEIDEKGTLLECWIELEVGQHTSLANLRSTLSGRWLRSLGREYSLYKNDLLSPLYKDLHTLKAKDTPIVHWNLHTTTTRPLPWMMLDGAIIGALQDARSKVGIAHHSIPFEKVR